MESVQLRDQQATGKSPKLLGLAAAAAAVLALTSLAMVGDLTTVGILGRTRTGEFSSVIRDLIDLPVNFTVTPADILRATTTRVVETVNGMILVPRLVAQLLVGLNMAIISLYGVASLKRRLTQFRLIRIPQNVTQHTETVAEAAELLSHQSNSSNHCENPLARAAKTTCEISQFNRKTRGLWKSSRSIVRIAGLATFADQRTKSQAQLDLQPQLTLPIVEGKLSTPTTSLPNQTPVRSEV